MIVLGIETSCDDTAAALVENGSIVRSNVVASQNEYHHRFGGVVPEIAARKHLEHILPVVTSALDQAGLKPEEIDGIASTYRPGLVGSLLVGLSCAKSIALVYGKRLIGINHLEAHAYAGVFAGMQYGADHIALVVSGGHTSLLEYRDRRFRLLGRTVDDAAGEAYDKIAKILNLGYPGGPVIDRIARQGDPGIYRFPRPMLDRDNFNFSFSGLKTAVAYYMHHHPGTATSDLCAAFQEAVVDVLVTKTIEAAKKFKHQTIAVTGGVASNSRLRGEFSDRATSEGIRVFIPAPVFCTDNAAMVAGLAYWKLEQGDCSGLDLGVSSDSGFAIDPSM